jgi:hypothetical protein
MKMGKWVQGVSGVLVLVDAIVGGVLWDPILNNTASQQDRRWFGHLASLEAILIISIAIGVIHGIAVRRAQQDAGSSAPPISGILIGADNRLSTSKLSAFAWTWVLAWAMLSLAFADWVKAPGGWNAFLKEGLEDRYLILLGGPFVALVAAKALVGSAVASGSQNKPPASDEETTAKDRVSQAFSDDTGQTDLVDTQYLLFGAIALLVFIVMFIRQSYDGLPQLPDLLVGLASVGATTYVANKWSSEDARPHIDRIVPDHATPGETITIYGTNLLSITQAGKRIPATDPIQIIYGGLGQQELAPNGSEAHPNPSGNDYIRTTFNPIPSIAAAAPPKDHVVDISIRNSLGAMSDNTAEFTITA